MRLLLLVPLAVFAAVLGFSAAHLVRDNDNTLPSTRIGQMAPQVQLEEIPGRALFTDEMLREGGPKLVNFWASWCPPCRAEHPVLEELAAEGVTLYGVNYRDQLDRAEAFLAELGDPYRAVGADPRARMGLDWGVVGLPETFVVDGSGKIVLRHAGPITREIFEARLRPALEGTNEAAH